ncbi:MAG: putative metal-binding motif-containing protein [Polyangiaceae bacterium]
MSGELRTALLTAAIALAGCGEIFDATGTPGGTGGTGAGPTTSDGGAGTGGTGGTSGTGATTTCDSEDHDGDGYSQCDGDCDDTIAFVHPDAIEICGDGIDENCDGMGDDAPPCNGMGTFVSQAHGTVGAKGTMDDPVAMISEGIAKAEAIGGTQLIFVSAGTYSEDLTLVGDRSLVGGYHKDDWTIRDPAIHKTIINALKPEGLKVISAKQPMLVDGFVINGRSVSVGDASSFAVTVDGGDALLSNNTITGGAITAGAGVTAGVQVITAAAPGSALGLYGNVIDTADATLGPAIGVLADSADMTVTMALNQISAGKGTESIAVLGRAAAALLITGNVLQSGVATGKAGTPPASFGLWMKAGKLVFDSNLVNPYQVNDPPKCLVPDAWCGGVRVSTPEATLTNNIISGAAHASSVALHLSEDQKSLAFVVVANNLFLASGDDGVASRSTSILLGSPVPDAGVTSVGRFRNNIFFGGIAAQNFAFFEQQIAGEAVQPAALDHNLFFFPVEDPNPGILYLDWNGVSPSYLTMLDQLPGDGANLYENPLLVAGHIEPESPCRNAGTPTDAPPKDRDQDPRPQEGVVDIGPDELVPD